MDSNLSEVLLSDDFNAPEYVADFLRSVKPGEEAKHLQALRQTFSVKANVAADQIKDIVFDHYRQFIDASKEITNLEREIYQLSSLLGEQKSLIEGLMELSGMEKRSSCTSVSANSGFMNSQQTQQLQTVMNRLDGVASVLNSMNENERIFLQGQMVLLDGDTMQPKHAVYLVLLSNNLLIGHPNATPVGAHKHPFHLISNIALDSLALINVKGARTGTGGDLSAEQHLIQLLAFPQQLYFRCESARAKRDWLEAVEDAKRRQQEERALVRQATIRARRRNILSSIVSRSSPASSPGSKSTRRTLVERKISELDEEMEGEAEEGQENEQQRQMADKEWLDDLVNELQDVLSHRHMEEAVEMLLEWKQCGCKDPVLNAKFIAVERQLVQLLTEDIKRTGPLHEGSRSLSQPIKQLIELGRTAYAMELYLRRRSSGLRAAARELTVSEEPLSYVRQLAIFFVKDIIQVCEELTPFDDHICLVLAWSSRELSVMLSLIRRNVIEVAPTMTVLTNTWRIMQRHCAELTSIGLDLSFEVNRLAAPSLQAALKTNFDNILESIRLRNSEERWTPFSLESDLNLMRFLEEMSDIGLQMEWAICRPETPSTASGSGPLNDNHRFALNVSQSACHFARTAIQLSRDLSVLNSSPHLHKLTDEFMQTIWSDELGHLVAAREVQKLSVVYHCSSRFVISQVLPLCERHYIGEDDSQDGSGGGPLHLLLIKRFSDLVYFQRRPSISQQQRDEVDIGEEGEEVANV